jgi:hypothetical protein
MLAETWRGTWVVAYREILRFFAERSRLLSALAFPLLFLVIFGAGFSNVIGNLAPGVDFIQFMYPGIIAMTVLTTSLFAGVSVVGGLPLLKNVHRLLTGFHVGDGICKSASPAHLTLPQ